MISTKRVFYFLHPQGQATWIELGTGMATSRWSFTHEGHAFCFNLITKLVADEFIWHADIWCDQQEIGQLSGHLLKDTVPVANWAQSALKEMAAGNVQDAIKRRLGVDW